jgi:hypothetical protein
VSGTDKVQWSIDGFGRERQHIRTGLNERFIRQRPEQIAKWNLVE